MEIRLDLAPLATLAETFAVDEHLCTGEGKRMGRLWRHGPSLVPGLRDMRLPMAQAAVAALRAEGVEVHERSSGGRLVVLDEGVVNIAIAFSGQDLPSVEAGFRLMADVLLEALVSCGLRPGVGEVPGSICPGRYDLALDGRKVAGLSQRRRRTYALIHAFLLVEGTGAERLERAEDFYRRAGAPPEEGVRPGSMAALQELDPALGVSSVAGALAAALRSL